MPISAAAMEGITANGHRWKHQIKLARFTNQIGDFDYDTPEEKITTARDEIVKAVDAWLLGPSVQKDTRLHEATTAALDELRDCEPDIDELRGALNTLFDEFDYYRVVSV